MLGSIRSRLLILAELPVLVVIIILAGLIWIKYQEIREMDALSPLDVAIGKLLHEVQIERGVTVGYLRSRGQQFASKLVEQRRQTQLNIEAVERLLTNFDPTPYGAEFRQTLQSALEEMKRIKEIRLQVDTHTLSARQAIELYTQHNRLWLKLILFSSRQATGSKAGLMRAAYQHFMEGKELVGIERALLNGVFLVDTFQDDEYGYFQMLVAMQNSFIDQFKTLATPKQVALFEQKMLDPSIATVQHMQNVAFIKGEPTSKPHILCEVYKRLGYGGAIHHFKNLILRRTPFYKQQFDEAYQLATKALNEYETQSNITEDEKTQIKTIRETFEKYKAMSNKAVLLAQKGQTIKELDNNLKIDDGPALNALHKLTALTTTSHFGIDPVDWFNAVTKKIELMKEVEDQLAEDIRQHGIQLSDEAREALTDLALLAVVVILLALISSFLMAQNITRPLHRAIQFAEQIAANKLEGTVESKRTDELGTLVQALNQMASNLRTIIRDLTQNEKMLKQAQLKAEQANQAKNEFIANISHELRTPMHAILSFAAMGEEKIDTASHTKIQGYFSRIHESGQRLLKLINELLDLSKLEAGCMEMERERHDLKEIVEMVTQELSELIQQKSLKMETAPIEIKTEAYIDYNRLSQVIRNLLSNAIKFTPEGKSIHISYASTFLPAKCDDQNNREVPAIAVSIMDQGIGIPEEELAQVFDKFVQSSKTKKSGGGTGLGLAISKEIIELHGGIIRAKNTPVGGAIFTFIIPYDAAAI